MADAHSSRKSRAPKGSTKWGERVEKPCAQCGDMMTLIPSVAKKRTFCSRECSRQGARTGSVERPCDQCGAIYRPIRTKGAAVDGVKPNVWSRHCSPACGLKSSLETRLLAGAPAREAHSLRKAVRRELAALKRIGRHFMSRFPNAGGPKVIRPKCATCGDQLGPTVRGPGKHVCAPCKRIGQMKARRIANAKRRAIERGADADLIDPISVFNRDKWRCQECGRKTPRSKRGTVKANAPELDHIISLADGGTHTWSNVQCLCRKCNQEKGAFSRGQLHMFAA